MFLEVDTTAAKVEILTSYSFTDIFLAAEAVQMAAPTVGVIYGSIRELSNNKRLAILGNTVLTKALCSLWYAARNTRGPGNKLDAAGWTRLRNDVLSNDSLAERGYDLNIDTFVFCNEGTSVSAKMVATTLEAIIGAVHQDGGDAAALRVITHLGFTEHPLLLIPAPLVPASSGRTRFTSCTERLRSAQLWSAFGFL